jgi:head-tail adaptor
LALEQDYPIGKLRWLVTLAQREQTPAAGGGITETLKNARQVHACIEAVGALTFWGGQQVDTPVTHKIVMRFQNYLDQTFVVIRETVLPEGPPRKETFRIRRIKEFGGRKSGS